MMQEILKALHDAIPDAQITHELSGARLRLHVASSLFSGMTRLKQQQMVNNVLLPWIDDGRIHALELKTHILEEHDGN